jgi:hypothetical protein
MASGSLGHHYVLIRPSTRTRDREARRARLGTVTPSIRHQPPFLCQLIQHFSSVCVYSLLCGFLALYM